MTTKKVSPDQLINIIDKIATKLALTDEPKLEAQLEEHLPKLLSLILFPDTSVRNKVVAVLSHINKRAKDNHEIKLPLEKILDLYLSPSDNPFLRNFSLLYLQMGFERALKETKTKLLPKMIADISTRKDTNQKYTLLRFITEAIQYLDTSTEDMEKFSYMKNEDKQILLSFWKDVLLCTSDYSLSVESINIPAGLSIESLRHIIGNKKLSSQELYGMKNAIINILKTEIFSPNETFFLLLIGSCDEVDSVSNNCETAIKKLSKIDLEDEKLIKNLYDLYLGDKETGRNSANEKMKNKILFYLAKSKRAANTFPQARDVLNDSVFAEYSSFKLKGAGMQFFIWILGEADDENIKPFAKDVFDKLIAGLFRLKSGNTDKSSFEQSQQNTIKDYIYVGLGSLAKKFPYLLKDKFYVLQKYFEDLNNEDPRVRISIQQGLSSLIYAFKDPNKELQNKLENLFLRIVSDEYNTSSSHAIFSALQCANKLFPFDHIPSRFICLLCVDDSHLTVREEALRGTDIETFSKYRHDISKGQKESVYPDFPKFISYIHDFLNRKSRDLSSVTFIEILSFSKKCLYETAKRSNYSLADYIKYLDNEDDKMTINQIYLNVILTALHERATGNLQYEAADSLLQLLSLQSDLFGPRLVDKIGYFKNFLFTGEELSRERMARFMGILYFYLNDETREKVLKELISTLEDAPESTTHGVVMLFGNIISLHYKKYQIKDSPNEFEGLIEKFVTMLDHHKPLVRLAACYSIGQIGRYGGLCYLSKSGVKRRKTLTIAELVQTLIDKLLKRDTDTKLQEKLVSSLGLIGLGHYDDPSLLELIFNALFKLNDNRAEELQFTIGETLSLLCGGENFCVLHQNDEYNHVFPRKISNEEKEKEINIRNDCMKAILTRIIKEGVLHPKKIVRLSAAIWLLGIVRYCPKSQILLQYVKDVQKAFSILLTDTHDVTQEVAARGLTFVYELGDETTKKKLVDSLVKGLTEKKRSKDIKISDDSELLLFPENAKTNLGGGELSTYKEMASVATDVGKPDLIYKLLSVSSHHALWNAKKAAAFSVSTIISTAGKDEELQKILPKILPKLYRYLYDPNPAINQAMTQMWNSLVENTRKTVDLYLDAIMKEILNNITNELWRVREACCLAISDIYSGRTFSEMKPYLERSLELVFRVMDDIKESCQKAAKIAIRRLGAFSVKCCDPVYTKPEEVKMALEIVLNVLLKKGIYFPVESVRVFSLEHIEKISKVAKEYIKPHITDIAGTLLEQASALEPAVLNYLQHGGDKIMSEMIDKVRMSILKDTPITDTINNIKRHIDDKVLESLIPRLLDILRTGVGTSTRTGTANFLSELCKAHRNGIKPFVKSILSVVMNILKNTKNVSERTSLSSALPHILKAAKVSHGKRVMEQIREMYMDINDDDTHYIAGVVLYNLAIYVPNILKRFYTDILPLIVIAKFDKNERVSKIFKKTFDEIAVTGPAALLRDYVGDIVKECVALLDHSQFRNKRQGALGLAELIDVLKDEISEEHLESIIRELMKNLSGRIWDDKEVLLDSLATACVLLDKKSVKIQHSLILSSIINQFKKSLKYKLHALKAFNKILKETQIFKEKINLEIYENAKEILKEDILPKVEEKEVKREIQKLNDQIQTQSIYAYAYLIPKEENIQIKTASEVLSFLIGRLKINLSQMEAIANLNALEIILNFIIKKEKIKNELLNEENIKNILIALLRNIDPNEVPIEVRTEGISIFSNLVKSLKENLKPFHNYLIDELEKIIQREKHDNLRNELTSLVSLLK